MKKIKLFPAPNVELRIHVSDEMERDYRECDARIGAGDCSKICSDCSWHEVNFGNIILCALDEMEQLLEENHGQINTPAKQRD